MLDKTLPEDLEDFDRDQCRRHIFKMLNDALARPEVDSSRKAWMRNTVGKDSFTDLSDQEFNQLRTELYGLSEQEVQNWAAQQLSKARAGESYVSDAACGWGGNGSYDHDQEGR